MRFVLTFSAIFSAEIAVSNAGSSAHLVRHRDKVCNWRHRKVSNTGNTIHVASLIVVRSNNRRRGSHRDRNTRVIEGQEVACTTYLSSITGARHIARCVSSDSRKCYGVTAVALFNVSLYPRNRSENIIPRAHIPFQSIDTWFHRTHRKAPQSWNRWRRRQV